MKTNVILDVSNLFYSSFYAHSKEQDNILLAMANKSFMDIINKYSRETKSDEVVLAFDGSRNWRKSYTKNAPDADNPGCLTYKKYKGHRREKMTDKEKQKLEVFDKHVIEFREMLKEYTGLLILHNDRLEADDLIAGFIKMHPGEKHLIVSQDRDYLQLLRYSHVSILDPKTGKQLTLIEYDHDPDFFMFQKCIRGDAGDNVISSYPRIREPKIKAAYEDDYELTNLLNHEFDVEYLCPKTGTLVKRHYVTKDVFEENAMLMDLTSQPTAVKEIMNTSIKQSLENRGTYHMVKFLRFCNRMDFQHIIQNITNYNKLLRGPVLKD
jgi:hypothetical protein